MPLDHAVKAANLEKGVLFVEKPLTNAIYLKIALVNQENVLMMYLRRMGVHVGKVQAIASMESVQRWLCSANIFGDMVGFIYIYNDRKKNFTFSFVLNIFHNASQKPYF